MAETRSDVVYIGMGETQLRGNVMQGDGVYKSSDAGKTWRHMGLADTHAIARIRVHPKNPQQQAGRAAAQHRDRRRQADRGLLRGVDGPVGAARDAAGAPRRVIQIDVKRFNAGLKSRKLAPVQ